MAVAVVASVAILCMFLILAVAMSGHGHGHEHFTSPVGGGADRYLSLVHIAADEVLIRSDEIRGPSADDLESSAAVRQLRRNGLRVVRDGHADMYLTDATSIAAGARIVTPLLGPKQTRTLVLYAAAEAGAELPVRGVQVQAICPGRLEAELFAVAWAAAGGSEAGAKAATYPGPYDSAGALPPAELRIAVAWGCPGSRAMADAEAAAKGWSRSGKARRLSYGDRDGAQHLVAARAPSLRLKPSIVPGESSVLSTPSLVVMAGEPRENHPATSAMAAEIARLASADNERGALAMAAFLSATSKVPLARPQPLQRMSRQVKAVIDASLPYERPAVPILEQFSGPEPAVELVPGHDVQGRFIQNDMLDVEALLSSGRIDGVKLRRGDRVILSEQTRNIENGSYVVVDAGDNPLLLTRVTVTPEQYRSSLRRGAGTSWVWSFFFDADLVADIVRPGESVVWGPTRSPGVLVAPGRVDVSDSDLHADADAHRDMVDWLHPLAVCSADPIVPTRELCDTKGGFWDHPCTSDSECPFFTAETSPNTSETTYRGGCMAGYCEMPAGVRLAAHSFRHPDPRDLPVCHCASSTPTRASSHSCCDQGGRVVFELDGI